MELSVVITVYNEEENIKPLFKELVGALGEIDYEVIMVDDGSTDKTVDEIEKNGWERVKTVILDRNYGQTPALAAGIDVAEGEYIATLDGDLQNDPADLPIMLSKLKEEDWDLVGGYRKDRQDKGLTRILPSKIANWIIRNLTGVKSKDYGCSTRVFKAYYAKNMELFGELHRFIPVLVKLQGAKITEIPARHHPRRHGVSKYGLGRTFKVMSDLLLILFFQKYFRRPIHLFGPLGFLLLFIGTIIYIYLIWLKILGNDIWGKPLIMAGLLFILMGIQIITFGIIAELIQRIYFKSGGRNIYRIRKILKGKREESQVS